jgi:hypothetical protein
MLLRIGLRLRAWVAVAAAYALALQVILGGILATQMVAAAVAAPADPFVICYGGTPAADHENSGAPVNHAACLVCALASFAPPLPESATVVSRHEVAAYFAAIAISPAKPRRLHDPRSSQGPPQAA